MQQGFDKYRQDLSEFVAFKSISTDAAFAEQMHKTVDWLKTYAEKSGASVEIINLQNHNPLVLINWHISDSAETVLIYGHYDVQPAKTTDPWHADPFELFEKDEKLFARGVVDNKGQILIHLHTVSELFSQGQLNKNVKFLIEGNEESGNNELPAKLIELKDKLRTDKIVISDGQIIAGYPTIEMGLRGSGNLKITLKTANSDLHSGIFGGAAPSATTELSRLLAGLYAKDGTIQIDGFYANVEAITNDLRANNAELMRIDGNFKERATVQQLVCETGNDPYTQVGLRPTLQISGIQAGYTGEGYANIVPCVAEARINVRMVANQNPKEVKTAIINYFESNAPDYCELTFESEEFQPAVRFRHNEAELNKIRALLEKNYGCKSYLQYCGGSIPVVQTMQTVFGVDPFLISLGNDDCRMHGVNENFNIKLIKSALGFSREYFSK